MGPATYKGPLTRSGFFTSFSRLFYFIHLHKLSTRSITNLVLKSIARSEFRSFSLKPFHLSVVGHTDFHICVCAKTDDMPCGLLETWGACHDDCS
jgi:hypothetical protein